MENGQVDTLIVKDMSRLGREYLQVGQYTELIFPSYGVRFIAVNDGVDTINGIDDSTGKVTKINDDSQEKLQNAMEKIVNESSGGLICIII